MADTFVGNGASLLLSNSNRPTVSSTNNVPQQRQKLAADDGSGRTPNQFSRTNYSYAGSDFRIWIYFPRFSADDTSLSAQAAEWFNVQTVTSSVASSITAVEKIGSSAAVAHTRGQKTYAGSLIFTVLEKEPLEALLQKDIRGHEDYSPDYFTLDQLPPFNIVIEGSTETLQKSASGSSPFNRIFKVIVGVRLMQYGETVSVDDMFLEQSHTYTATYVTPWMNDKIDFSKLTPPKDKNDDVEKQAVKARKSQEALDVSSGPELPNQPQAPSRVLNEPIQGVNTFQSPKDTTNSGDILRNADIPNTQIVPVGDPFQEYTPSDKNKKDSDMTTEEETQQPMANNQKVSEYRGLLANADKKQTKTRKGLESFSVNKWRKLKEEPFLIRLPSNVSGVRG